MRSRLTADALPRPATAAGTAPPSEAAAAAGPPSEGGAAGAAATRSNLLATKGTAAVAAARTVLLSIIRKIVPEMTEYGLGVIELCCDMLPKDCPRARSGGAALAAANILGVPDDKLVQFLREANDMFSDDEAITFATISLTEFFVTFLRKSMNLTDSLVHSHVRAALAGGASLNELADEMMSKDLWLLGYNPKSGARPNESLMELLRWLLKGTPRPQCALSPTLNP